MGKFMEILKADTQWVEPNALAQLVFDRLISGQDEPTRKTVLGKAKGGFLLARTYDTRDGRYRLFAGNWNSAWIFGPRKVTYLYDSEAKTSYQIVPKDWKAFYNALCQMAERA